MNQNLYLLYDLGILASEQQILHKAYDFSYLGYKWNLVNKESFYEKIHVSANSFVTGLLKEPEFCLKIREDHLTSKPILSIFLQPNNDQDTLFSVAKERILQLCFDFDEPISMDTDNDEVSVATSGFNDLYNKLKEAHAKLDQQSVDQLESFQLPDKLRPILRPYQLKAVRWMLQREQHSENFDIKPIKLSNPNHPTLEFFMDRYTSKIYDVKPEPRRIPAGGLLCDEMGLGKTVEILSLILHNPKTMAVYETDCLQNIAASFTVANVDVKKHTLHCICLQHYSKKAQFVKCTTCNRLQHLKCVLANACFKTHEYRCPDCWYKSGEIVESRTTIIVSPHSIKYQWLSEIKKHVRDKNFRVFDYRGVKVTGWISPMELAQYDVVLTDYEVLRSEIYFTSLNFKKLRNEKKHAIPVSPLPMIKWWRSCLDEAQMVETPTSQCARMVQMLPACFRWGVTGTPIERKIGSLYGLISFLKYDPFTYSNVWQQLVHDFEKGHWQPLILVLQRVMWRTCKVDVEDQIAIPPQSNIVHFVNMSDLQLFFYRSEHARSASDFNRIVSKYVEADWSLSVINTSTLKSLLEPLRKLRFDCTVPSILNRVPNENINKRILTPNELHNHLIKNTEHECKTCLRTISSGLNGIAGCHIAKAQFTEAIACYKSLLKLASEYNSPNIHVDTLLQIHAIHNFLDIASNISLSEDEKVSYKKQLENLESKYIVPFYEKVKAVEDRLNIAKSDLKKIPVQLNASSCGWWRDILFQSTEATILEKIYLELSNRGFNSDTLEKKLVNIQYDFRTVQGVIYILVTWLDKIEQERSTVIKKFAGLDYFINNLKPDHAMSEDDIFKRNYLIRTAFECHLDVPPDSDDEDEIERRTNIPKCQLCRIKDKLNEYECIIFDKTIVGDKIGLDKARGTWNPSFQEIILKTLYMLSKRDKFKHDIIEKAEATFKLLEAIKEEFKEYSQYWVEINYSVAAFDELQMCKSRLEPYDIDEIVDDRQISGRNANMRFPKNLVDEVASNLQEERNAAELGLVRAEGKLKYLNHLKEAEKPDNCPVCKQSPDDKYAVLLCGHLLCYICVNQMAKYQRNILSCAICRNKQHYSDILYVTTKVTSNPSTAVKGSYSGKITKIVETVLEILQEDNDTKIVIFSTWELILNWIGEALKNNDIKFVSKSSQPFHVTIETFKDYDKGITCLLLPLQLGSRGLNLVEATHVFLVEPILDASEEKQAISRIHRIGQTRKTFVHRFIMLDTIEETIHNTCQNWDFKNVTVKELQKLFLIQGNSSTDSEEGLAF